jgi:hypothetical protein
MAFAIRIGGRTIAQRDHYEGHSVQRFESKPQAEFRALSKTAVQNGCQALFR